VVVTLLLVWGLTDVRRRAEFDPQNPGRHQTDFTVYTEAGAAFFDGRDPYAVTNPRGWYYLYPPLFALLVAPLHGLSTSWQGVIWFLLNLLMIAGCIWECRRIAERLRDAATSATAPRSPPLPPWMVGAAAIAVLFPLLDTLQRGQVGIAVLLPLLSGFRLMLKETGAWSWFSGGALLSLPIAMKITPALPVAILLLQHFAAVVRADPTAISVRRFWHCLSGVLSGLVLFLLLMPTTLIGWEDNITHLKTWYREVVANERLGETKYFSPDSIRNQSLSNALHLVDKWANTVLVSDAPATTPLVDRSSGRTIVLLSRTLLTLILIAAAFKWPWASNAPVATAVFGLACVMSLPISAISWGHHFVILLPGVLFLPWVLHNTSPIGARWMAALPAVLSLLHYVTLEVGGGIAGKLGILGIGITIWCIAGGAFLLRLKPSPDLDEELLMKSAPSYCRPSDSTLHTISERHTEHYSSPSTKPSA